MSNLRWILLFAGFAILLLLYFSGRPKKKNNGSVAGNANRDGVGGAGQSGADGLTPELDVPGGTTHGMNRSSDRAHFDASQGHLAGDPLMGEPGGTPHGDGQGSGPGGGPFEDGFSPSDAFGQVDPADLVRPAGSAEDYRAQPVDIQHPAGVAPVMLDPGKTGSGRSISEKIEAFSAKLTPKRKSRIASSAPAETTTKESGDEKVILLHVVAPEGQLIDGPLLLDVLEQRGYHYGDMQIFHSLHEAQPVFSIAKIVEPGSFDIDDISSFVTPGLVMILQLPGPVSGDVAFEVLVSEAQEIAAALGCQVLDSDRSTLSKQTVQHLRESVYEYMHRQKYFGKVSS